MYDEKRNPSLKLLNDALRRRSPPANRWQRDPFPPGPMPPYVTRHRFADPGEVIPEAIPVDHLQEERLFVHPDHGDLYRDGPQFRVDGLLYPEDAYHLPIDQRWESTHPLFEGRCMGLYREEAPGLGYIETPFHYLLRGSDSRIWRVRILPDHVAVRPVAILPIRIVHARAVRAVVVDDFLAAFPDGTWLIEAMRRMRSWRIHFADVAIWAGSRETITRIVSIKSLIATAHQYEFDQSVGGTSFLRWAAQFPEHEAAFDLDRFYVDPLSYNLSTRRAQQGPPTVDSAGAQQAFRAALLSFFPNFDPLDMTRRPVAIRMADGEVEFYASRRWAAMPLIADGEPQAPGVQPPGLQASGTALVVPAAVKPEPFHEWGGLRLTTKYRLSYVWAGSIAERVRSLLGDGAALVLEAVVADLQATADGGRVPSSLIDLAAVGAPKSFQGRVVPWILRRNCDADASRTILSRGWIQVGALDAALAAVREDAARRSDADLDALVAFDAFVVGDVADLIDHLDETGPDGPTTSSPTESGEEVVIPMTFVRGEERRDFEVVFDKVLRTPWLSVEQLAFIQGMDLEALRRQLHRFRQTGTVTDRDVKTVTSAVGSDRRRARSFVAWDFARHVLMAKTKRRRDAVADVVLQACRSCEQGGTALPLISANLL